MSDELCFFCEENTLDHTYACCKKQCCKECYTKIRVRDKQCPWCKQTYSVNNNNLLCFEEWLTGNNIARTDYVNRCIDHINTIKECFANKHTDTIEFQVANLNKIHVIKYRNIDEISFQYWKAWGTIEVTGGRYYRYGIYRPSDQFGWWLYGFVKQL